MNLANYIFILCALLSLSIGFLAFINPNMSKWIRAPGGPRLKGTIAIITGIILLIAGLIVEFPTE